MIGRIKLKLLHQFSTSIIFKVLMLTIISLIVLISLILIRSKLKSVWVEVLDAERCFDIEDKIEDIIRG